jgi:hypothetical protein
VLSIIQVTNINNKGKMTSYFNFDIDGTFNMKFNFTGDINVSHFYTALTCTSPNFLWITFPEYKQITANADTPITGNLGEIIQYDSTNKLELTIRHSMCNTRYNKTLGRFITQNSNYSKYYYEAVGNNDGTQVNIKSLMFEKALDFNSRQ